MGMGHLPVLAPAKILAVFIVAGNTCRSEGQIRGTPHPVENDLQNVTINQGKVERFVRLPRVLETASTNLAVSGENKLLNLMICHLLILQNEFHCFSCCFHFD